MRSRRYTVLLLYPAHMTDGNVETFLAHILAPDIGTAVLQAQLEAADANNYPFDEKGDFVPLFVCAGHQMDLLRWR